MPAPPQGSRCTHGLPADDWEVAMREEGAGQKLWNLLAVCPECRPPCVTPGADARRS